VRAMLKVVIVAVSLATSGQAVAGPFQDGNNAFARGDLETAYKLFRSEAERGHAGAQFNLGLMYNFG